MRSLCPASLIQLTFVADRSAGLAVSFLPAVFNREVNSRCGENLRGTRFLQLYESAVPLKVSLMKLLSMTLLALCVDYVLGGDVELVGVDDVDVSSFPAFLTMVVK